MSAKTVPKQQSSTKQSNEQIIGGFNELRQEQRQVANKVAELEADLTEHKLVTEALAEVDGQRKCFRMIGGVLVERTVAEVLPSLQKNKEMISSLIETLKQQIIQKGQQITEYMDKHGIQVRSQPTAGDDNNKAGDQKAVVGGESSGVLV
ncbi:prefoldin subunit 2-like [Oppia nitens]|uniref:prefoldin subunit 2-like n=1 Tax=Oppia nitens TaxID=1686743 RepID=UPI0023DCA3C1|nr:prefoldin subunit 2-like [Oppia nitens]